MGAASRRRSGHLSSNTAAPVDRIAPQGGVETTDFPATANIILVKKYIVRAPLTAPFQGLRRGDGIDIRMDRDAADATDTCTGTVFVSHVDVTYTSISAP